MIHLETSCLDCGRVYPLDGAPYRCPVCGGLYDIPAPLPYDPGLVDLSQPGIWRYRHTFGLPDGAQPVSLGEGGTPLLWAEAFGRQVAFKCEFSNPTGSFKDRGSAVIAARLMSRGVTEAVEDSSGNAGASFAAYAARAGIRARIFVPASAAGPKRQQIEAFAAELHQIHGSRSDVSAAVLLEAAGGSTYASHAWLPFNMPGYATASYEIMEQLGRMPAAVVVPAGHGGLLLGLFRGFEAVRHAGRIAGRPRMVGVQALACAPLWAAHANSAEPSSTRVTEGQTLAEGVRVLDPLRREAVLRAVKVSGGAFVAVDEPHILPGRDALAQRGLYVEPTSAIVWRALEEMLPSLPDPVVVVLTGSGYKFKD
jgi:threonine synthase